MHSSRRRAPVGARARRRSRGSENAETSFLPRPHVEMVGHEYHRLEEAEGDERRGKVVNLDLGEVRVREKEPSHIQRRSGDGQPYQGRLKLALEHLPLPTTPSSYGILPF